MVGNGVETVWLFLPCLAKVFEGCAARERLEALGKVIGV